MVAFRLSWLFHPAGRLLLAVVAAVWIALEADGSGMRLFVALLIVIGGILQAVPWALASLRFEFDIGRSHWSKLMGDAEAAVERGDVDLAAARLEAALGDARRFPRPVLAADSAEHLADLMLRAGRREEAERWLAEALRQRERVPGRDHPRTRATRDRLADLRADLGDQAGAEELLTAQLQSLGRAEGKRDAEIIAVSCRLAGALAAQGRDDEAEPRYREVLDRLERANGAHHWSLGDALLGLAGIARRAGRPDEAEQLLRRALDNADMAGQQEMADRAREALLDFYTAGGRYADAVPLSEKLLLRHEAGATTERAGVIASMTRHADLLGRVGRDEDAGRYRRRAELLRAVAERR
jgi:tetratricopeptide (TPR) repeat protein